MSAKRAPLRKPVVVIGLGNLLMSDEGVGIHLVRRLTALGDKYPVAEFVDAGTGGMSVLHLIEGRQKAIFIDCARMGERPGVIRRFTPEQVETGKIPKGRSLHEADLLTIIDMAKRLGQCSSDVIIFGIEPENVVPGMELSGTLAQSLDAYVEVISKELSN